MLNWVSNSKKVMGLNRRNLDYVFELNPREYFPLVDDKVKTKKFLNENNLPGIDVYLLIENNFELKKKLSFLKTKSDIVIKPANGFGGNGILVLSKSIDGGWLKISGEFISINQVEAHLGEILFGVYSMNGLNDSVIVEKRVEPINSLKKISPMGLPDIRIICHLNKPIQAMLRLPTNESDGKANLHQGGVGVGIDIKNGRAIHCRHKNKDVDCHPDTGEKIKGYLIQDWDEILSNTIKTAELIPMKYLGFDWVLTEEGPKILELNARPGLEIQNANQQGLIEIIKGSQIE